MPRFENKVRAVKQLLWNYAPPLFHLARFVRTSLHNRRERQIERRLRSIGTAFIEQCGLVVQDGPFRGMRYLGHTHGSCLLPKLIGSYEAELHEAIGAALSRGYDTIVDVGCAEGYYAAGMALALPAATVYGFDINFRAQQQCRELAELNGVSDRVIVAGECTPTRLQTLLHSNALLICDCEGAEVELLDPEHTPTLRAADLIVELHDNDRLDVAVTPLLLARFRESHDIELVEMEERSPSRFASIDFMAPEDRGPALHEFRLPGQKWAIMRSRVANSREFNSSRERPRGEERPAPSLALGAG